MEKCSKSKLVAFVNKYNILNNIQCKFQKELSSDNTILHVIDFMYKSIHENCR